MDDSSDDSDICEAPKNVNSILVKSRVSQDELADYAYKRRLGDLIFDANFEAGNLGYVENIDRYEYDLMVRPDIANSDHRIWFNFKISNQQCDQCAILTFVNLSENLRLFHEGYCPVIRSRKHPTWMNLDEDQVFYYRSQNHGNRFVLSIVMRFSTQDDEHQLALFYPYSHSTLSDFLHRWQVQLRRLELKRQRESGHGLDELGTRGTEKDRKITSKSPEPMRCYSRNRRLIHREDLDDLRTRSSLEITRRREPARSGHGSGGSGDPPGFKVEEVATSSLFRAIYCVSIGLGPVTIGTVSYPSSSSKNVVVVVCRTGGNLDGVVSLVCQGLMDYLLGESLVARAARECIDFHVVPMLDPDSIDCGNSCTDLLGRQHGRRRHDDRSAALMGANPTIYSHFIKVQQRIKSILSGVKCENKRAIVLELGVNLELMGSRILGSHHVETLRMERHLSVPKTMSKFIEGFYLEACRFSSTPALGPGASWLSDLTDGRFVSYELMRVDSDSSKLTIPSSSVAPLSIRFNADLYLYEVSPFGSFRRSLEARAHLTYNQTAYLTIGKAMVYSFVDLLRPRGVAGHVSSVLDSFRHHTDDIDDLTLNLAKLR